MGNVKFFASQEVAIVNDAGETIAPGPKSSRALLVGVGLAGLVGAALLAPGRAREAAEQPSYDIIDRLPDGIVVRRYGPRVAIETPMGGPMDAAFRRLASYIFGDNRGSSGAPERIAMTVPVEVSPAGIGQAQAMRFFAPARFTRDTLPTPLDPSIKVLDVAAETLAVKRFPGSGRGEGAARRRAELLDGLAGTGWVADGEPAFFFYDAPWVPLPLRRNEVVVRVKRAGSSANRQQP